ncbi:MAG: hypothetical protein AABX49_00965, partial [Nanoarchaeota archaeon]
MPAQGKYKFQCESCRHIYYSDNPRRLTRCPNCKKIIGRTFDTIKGKMGLHTGRVAYEKLKDAAHERIINKVDEKLSERGSGGGNHSSSAVGGFILILLIAFFIFGVVVSPGLESGFWQSKIGSPVKSVLQGTRQTFTFVGIQFSNINKILKGENIFSFESGGTEIKKKTGLSFGGSNVFGESDLNVISGYTNEEFGLNGAIVVGIIDEEIPMLRDVRLSCVIDDSIKGEIEMDDVNRAEDGEVIFDIYNPKPFDETRIPFYCKFDPVKNPNLANELLRKINTKTITLALTYPLEISTRLEVFALSPEKFDDYRGKYDLAFDELHEGVYADRNSKVLSKSKYESDAEIALWFDNQPLGFDEGKGYNDYNLRFAFKNKNPKNKFKLEKFSIELPEGMSFSDVGCEKFNNGVLMEEYFASINNALNNEVGGEHFG